jgi:Protein of unknown function (DUF3048) C-terminal domain/Protein of unknown function (DUF3048) N-terminal domain
VEDAMKRYFLFGITLILLLTSCGTRRLFEPATITVPALPEIKTVTPSPKPTSTNTPTITPTVTETATPTLTPTPVIYGPTNFPSNIDPLTGMPVSDPNLLDRRPIAIKINIVPRRSNRPPWGLYFADIVYDYYHNDGYSRFHAIFYGSDASLAGPIRSGRLLDYDLVHMYKSIFAFGSADAIIYARFQNSDFADRLVLEGNSIVCPPTVADPLCRYEPNTNDFLLGDTAALSAHVTAKGVENGRQNLDGMLFNAAVQPSGVPGTQVYVRYSGDNYTRWDYDPITGSYLRFQDNVFDTGQGEEYVPLIEKLNNEQLSAENVVVILARHEFFQQPPNEIVDITLSGTGTAYAFRDGQMYQLLWNRPTVDSVLYLTNSDGTAFPFKPGKTWFQVVGISTVADQVSEGVYRFNFLMP